MDRAGHLAGLLRQHRLEVHVRQDLDEIADLANQWQEERVLRALVGIGGDGTAAELANRTNPRVPITLMACGTANLLSKHIGLCDRPEKLCETILAGRILRCDAARAGERLFLAMFGCGFDAEVVRRMHHWRSRRGAGHISYLSYLKPIWESLRIYDYPAIHIGRGDRALESEEHAIDAAWVFIFNLPRYAWGLPLAPEAAPNDGLLDLCAFRRGSWWAGMQYLAAAQLGYHRRLSDCRIERGRRFRITSDRPVPYQLDGDPGGVLPVDVEVLPDRLTLLVPPCCPALGGAPAKTVAK